ncbi:MFS transporter [Streptomyces niger]|uniref:MFS transporter n=1 Tax=Streptomyces niger TaxID=66373 RepID=UPI00069A119C|nr:MFS transporter [Streptomyces niger]
MTSVLRTRCALLSLFLGAFAMGSGELIVVGVLRPAAQDLHVGVATAGGLVTAYALGMCCGGPLLTAVTVRLDRRTLLWLSLAGYVVGNAAAARASGFVPLLAARVGTGALQGLFLGAAFAVAARLVPAERMGRALAAVFGGIAVATAVGVPLGTLVGQRLGWRVSFAAIGALGLLALLLAVVCVPRVAATRPAPLAAQARHALAPRVLAVLGVALLLMGGQFAAFTYVTPFLADRTGITGTPVSLFLLMYGTATAVGVLCGGRAADRGAATTLLSCAVVLVAALALLVLAGGVPVVAGFGLLVWGLVGFGFVPSVQRLVLVLAGPGRDLAATLPAAAVNLGIAAGALVGGRAVADRGPTAAFVTGLLVCLAAVPAVWAVRRSTARAASAADPAYESVAETVESVPEPPPARGR